LFEGNGYKVGNNCFAKFNGWYLHLSVFRLHLPEFPARMNKTGIQPGLAESSMSLPDS
jgi:hypothetical protein